jgi:uncharacterized protein YqhQ
VANNLYFNKLNDLHEGPTVRPHQFLSFKATTLVLVNYCVDQYMMNFTNHMNIQLDWSSMHSQINMHPILLILIYSLFFYVYVQLPKFLRRLLTKMNLLFFLSSWRYVSNSFDNCLRLNIKYSDTPSF